MSTKDLRQKRTPEQQASAIMVRFASYIEAEDYVRDLIGNSTREFEANYWMRTLNEIAALKTRRTLAAEVSRA